MLREAAAGPTGDADPALVAEERSLLQRIGASMLRLVSVKAAPAPERDPAELQRLDAELSALQQRYEAVQTVLHQQHPLYAALTQPGLPRLSEVQRGLAASDATLFEYVLGRRKSWLFVITSDAIRVFTLPDQFTIERQVREVVGAARRPGSPLAQEARMLFKALIEPALHLVTTQRLVIVNDGALHYLPFELLLSEEPEDELSGSGRPSPATGRASLDHRPYLLQRCATSYTASAAALLRHAESLRGARAGKEFVGIAPVEFHSGRQFPAAAEVERGWSPEPLPGTESEVKAILGLHPVGSAVAILRERATKTALREEAPGCRYLHLATHGIVNESRPLFSGLLLTPGSPGDSGYLSAAEVLALKLSAEMVVLSACETGLGRLVQGEGVIGLTRAFMYAGAAAVVVSLWKVDDEATAELMKRFYELLGQGINKIEALRRAKESLIVEGSAGRNAPVWAHPFFWAPFVFVE
jgi:CHAT domain-containing protein